MGPLAGFRYRDIIKKLKKVGFEFDRNAKGRPKNYLMDEAIKQIFEVYSGWKEEDGISKAIANEDAVKISPSRYVAKNGGEG